MIVACLLALVYSGLCSGTTTYNISYIYIDLVWSGEVGMGSGQQPEFGG